MTLIEIFKSEWTSNKIEVFQKGKSFITRSYCERAKGGFDISEQAHKTYSGVERKIKRYGYIKA